MLFSTNSAGRIRHPHAKILSKIYSKWITDLNVECKAIKLLEDTTVKNLSTLGLAMNLQNQQPKHDPRQGKKTSKLDLNFCSVKNI